MSLHKKIYNQFLFTYILAILIFAVLYTCLSNQFYYGLSDYEKMFSREVNDIKVGIETSIKDSFKEYYNSSSVLLSKRSNSRVQEYIFYIDDLKVDSIHVNEENFIVNVIISLRRINDPTVEYKMSTQLSINKYNVIIYDSLVYRVCEVTTKGMDKYSTYINDINIKPIFYIKSESKQGVTGVVFSKDFNNKIETYIKMSDGIPSANIEKANFIYYFKWNFPRMLYLSMVTITTLGYGDIVPLTNIARILIGLEATLGIIILGWFGNRLIKKA